MQGTEESTQKMVIRLQTCNIPFSPHTAVLVNWSVIADTASFLEFLFTGDSPDQVLNRVKTFLFLKPIQKNKI